MTRFRLVSWLLVVGCVTLLIGTLAGPAQAQLGLASIWAVDDGEKIFRDNLTSPLKNGNSVWNGSSVNLSAARNEIVAFQLELQAGGATVNNVNVTVSNLTNGGNTIRGSHPLLAANNYLGMGVELFTEHYLNVTDLSLDPNEGYAQPWELGMTTGWMPDALVPFSAASGKGGAPFNISANQNQAVWVDIYVDKGLPAGVYTGTITVTVGGSTAQVIPLNLEVMNFTLSDTMHYTSMVFLGRNVLGPRHNTGTCNAAHDAVVLDYLRMAHRHRFELIGCFDPINNATFKTALDGTAYTSAYNYEGPGEGVGDSIFSVGTYGSWYNNDQTYFQTNSDLWENWFNTNAPSVTRFLYLYDEPTPDVYPGIQTRGNWIHQNPGPGHTLPVYISERIADDLIGYVDRWGSPISDYSQVRAASARARGEDVWPYAAHRPKTPLDNIDEWGIAFRLKPWIAKKCDLRRWFTWDSSHWVRNWNEINPNTAINVWADPGTWNTGAPADFMNGNGTLFYPGRDYVFPAEDRQYNGPVASIRMKMYRRGAQDYEYMWLAEQAGKGAQVQNVLQDLLPHVMDSAVPQPDWSNSNLPYEQARDDLADLVLGTARAPSARFQAAKQRGPAPLAVTFTDLSLFTPASWSWTFGDGGTSTGQSPSHTYSSLGQYTVTLTATNASGQDTEVKLNYINVIQEAVVYPDTWTGSWLNIVSGGLSNLQNDDQSYMVMQSTDAQKRYALKFTVDTPYTPSQVSRITYEHQVKRSSATQPDAGRIFIQRSDLVNQYFGFWMMDTTDTDWTFETTNVSNFMTSNGILGFQWCGCPYGTSDYTVSNDVMRWRLELVSSTITPIADFLASPRSGNAPLAVTFTDCSSNTPTSWSWTFGDGGTSTSRNPSHTYASGGSYNVVLTATNSAGADSETKTSYITVSGGGSPPVAAFSGTPTSGAAPLAVAFTDSSTNTPTSWSWNFGDSSTSTTQSPSHTYNSAGSYTVSLRATNAAGYDDEVKTNYITVTPPPPVAAFSGTPTSGTMPLAVTFTDSSTNTPTSWSWNFGDSSTSTTQSPSHTYSSAGTYTVSLRATNAYGYDDEVKTNYITVNPPAPVAAFSGTPTSGMAPLAVAFTDSSTNTPTSWSWNFGDSTTSTSQNPSHTYSSAGSYTVSLRATNAGGFDDEVKTSYISVSANPTPTFVAAGAVASGTGAITPVLPAGLASNDILLLFLETANEAISISNQNGGTWTAVTNSPQGTGTAASSTATRLTVFWSRYNGTQGAPTTSDSGNHQLGRVIAVRGCATSGDPWDVTAGGVESTADTSGSIPSATTTVANTLVVAAIAISLPDASGTANFSAWTNANLTSLTEQTDNTVTAGNGAGLAIATGGKAAAGAIGNTAVTCATSASKGMMSIALKPTGGGSAPVANFTGSPTSGTAPLAVSFTDTSTNTPTSWSWTFGDSSTSTAQNPNHTYAAGTYTVALTATNSYGSNTNTKTNYIAVTVPPPVANFTGTPVNGQVSLAVSFTDTSSNTPTSWSWTFGDDNTSTSQNPSHTYTTAGDYTVALTATNASGNNTKTQTNYITVSAANEVIVYPDTWSVNWYTPGCALQSGGLSDLTTDNGGYMVIRCDTSTQRYGIMYTADTIYPPAQVSQITYEYQAKMSRSDTPASTVRFTRKSDGVWEDRGGTWLPGTSDTDWTWNTTAVSTYMDSSGVIGFELCCCPTGGNVNNYDVSSDKMRFRLQLVTVNPPVANFTGTPTTGTAPLAVAFTDTSTNSPTSWSWNFGDSGTSTAQNPSHTYSAAGSYTVTLTATNSAGSDGETKTGYITVNPQEVYVYPYAYNWHLNGVGTLIAGGLPDVQTSNNGYMQVRCNASNYNSGLRYEFDTTYTPSQVSKITVEYELHSTRSDQPWYQFVFYKQDGSGGNTPIGGGLWTTTDQSFSWETTAVSTYMSSSGYMHVTMCGCNQNSITYDTYVDVARIKLTLN